MVNYCESRDETLSIGDCKNAKYVEESTTARSIDLVLSKDISSTK